MQALRWRTVLAREQALALKRYDALLTAGALGVADPADPNRPDRLVSVPSITMPFSVGGLPALAIPCGFSRAEGLPLSLQIAAAPMAEPTVLRIAHAYQQATDWHRRHPQPRLSREETMRSDFTHLPPSTPEEIRAMARRAGLDLPEELMQQFIEVWPAFEAMVRRIPRSRPHRRAGAYLPTSPAVTSRPALMSDAIRQHRTGGEDRFRVIFDSVADAIFVCDAETGTLIDVNATGCTMFGFSRDELIGCRLDALSTDLSSYVQRDPMTLLRAARSRGPQTFEWLCKAKSGHLFWGEISLRSASLGGRPIALAVLRDITQRKSKEDEVVQLAHFDVLTGLPNRRNFDVTLRQEIARSARYGGPLSVAMGDIDLFKIVNDTFGHQVGDVVLKSLAELMRKACDEAIT